MSAQKVMEPNQYAVKAQAVADKLGLVVWISRGDSDRCPEWDAGDKRGTCVECASTHGDHYTVKVKNRLGAKVTFDFWGSYADSKAAQVAGAYRNSRKTVKPAKRPTIYDVLSCFVSDASIPETADEVVEEFGAMKPSRALSIAESGIKARAFFACYPEAEMQELQEAVA